MDEADKRRVLDWLYDRNKIQRVSCESAAGKRDVIEQDVSGGLASLLRHLRSGGPFDPEIMMKLAEVLDPLGASTLHVGKRLRRGRGAPGKADTVRDAVRLVFEVRRQTGQDEASRRDIEKSRPISAAGMKRKGATKKEIQEASRKPRSTYYQRQKLSKQWRTKDI
jgi:hypothetical protein